MNDMSEKIKEKIAKSASDALTTRSYGGGYCIPFLLSEPKMPDELILEDSE